MKKKAVTRFAQAASLALALAIACQGSFQFCRADDAPTPDYTYVSAEQQELTSATNKCIRVDIGSSSANYANTSTPYWNNWMLTANVSSSAQTTYQGVTFTLSDNQGVGVAPGFNKKLVQSSGNTPTKTLDGVTAESSTGGDAVTLKISGLSAGNHSITTWHSSWDTDQSTSKIGSTMCISVDGAVRSTSVACPNSIDSDSKAGISFISFDVTDGQPVTVTIQSLDATKNAELSAFEIDTPDPSKTVSGAQPAEGDFHFDEDQKLSWQAGVGAVSHDVYLGTDFDAVNTATTSSDTFKGNQTAPSYALNGLDPALVYWWRIDEHTSSGEVIKGEVKCFKIRHLAFPTAEGYGRFADGGRGGHVVEVTNLNDSGPGSLRQALEVDKGPRIVVFRVGGVIALNSRITIPSDGGDVYVAGQTAPGDGITVTRYGLGLYTAKDVIIRDIRNRVGDYCGKAMDGMGMANADYSIIDHCSISWTTDEATSSRGAYNITFQKNLIAEALNDSVHYLDGSADRTGSQPHGFAASIGGNIGSFYRNLLTNCTGRNWSLAGSEEQDKIHFAGYLDITNNVVYNFRDRMTDGGARRVDFVNNYYKMGPSSLRDLPQDPDDPLYNCTYKQDGTLDPASCGVNSSLWYYWAQTGHKLGFFQIDGQEIVSTDMQKAYLNGNKEVDTHGNTVMGTGMEENWANVGRPKGAATMSDIRSDTPFFPSYVTTLTADDAYNAVLSDVGANKPKLDSYDQRYISEVKNGTYTYTGSKDGLKGIIDSQDDVGGYPAYKEATGPADSDHDGMPDSWEMKHGLSPNNAGDGKAYTLSADGYTNLEMYLDEAAGDPLNWANPTQTPVASTGDQGLANNVIDKINALSATVTLDNQDAVAAARAAYDALTDTQKQLVTNYSVLVAAEDQIKQLIEQRNIAIQQAISQSTGSTVTVDVNPNDIISKDTFNQVKAAGKRITFDVKNSDGTLKYSWSFDGSQITNLDVDLQLEIDFTTPNKSAIDSLTGDSSTMYLSFKHDGALPAPATIRLYVGDRYKNGDTLNLYYYNESTKQAELVQESLKVNDGYVEFTIRHCSDYFLTQKTINGTVDTGSSVPNPKTGSKSSFIVEFLLLIGCVAVSFVCQWLKRPGIKASQKQ